MQTGLLLFSPCSATANTAMSSQWFPLSVDLRATIALKLRMHAETDEFCSISRERSRKHSSRLVTVSHARQRVSLVRMPGRGGGWR